QQCVCRVPAGKRFGIKFAARVFAARFGGSRMNATGGAVVGARALALAMLSASMSAQAAFTSINPLGGGDGSERCLVDASSRCGGGAYSGAMSLISVFEKDLGYAQGSFVRVDDGLDKIWANTGNGSGMVQALARYANDSS